MAVPRNRLSNQRKRTRRAHHAKTGANTLNCSNCGAQRIPHRMCGSCGQYKDRSVKVLRDEA